MDRRRRIDGNVNTLKAKRLYASAFRGIVASKGAQQDLSGVRANPPPPEKKDKDFDYYKFVGGSYTASDPKRQGEPFLFKGRKMNDVDDWYSLTPRDRRLAWFEWCKAFGTHKSTRHKRIKPFRLRTGSGCNQKVFGNHDTESTFELIQGKWEYLPRRQFPSAFPNVVMFDDGKKTVRRRS